MKFKERMARVLMYMLQVFPIKNNKIVVSNFNGKGYGENPKYIIDEVLKKDKEFDVVWIVDKDYGKNEFPEGVRTVKQYSISFFYEMATAKIWIDNVRKPVFMVKRKNQYYLQSWHGGVALKKIEGDVDTALSKQYVEAAKVDSKNMNLILSNNRDFTEIVRRAFWYDGEIYEGGLPRNDIFFKDRKQISLKVKETLGIKNNIRMVLYAPTFRKDKKMNKLLELEVLESFKKKFGGEWICLLRLHPNVAQTVDTLDNDKYMINVSNYSDMQELLVAADVLITDYSSTMFSFSIMKKPVFLYTYDLAEYKKDRNFYYRIEELPYSMAETTEELSEKIQFFDIDIYQNKVESFLDSVGVIDDGKAGERVAKIIEDIVTTGEKK